MKFVCMGLAAALCLASGVSAWAQDKTGPGDPKPVKNENGKYFDARGNPTFHVATDGTVDFPTYEGFLRYHSSCHVCHGPDGLGSSYAPALVDSVKRLSYVDFLATVAGGRQDVNTANDKVMPAFGLDRNVMCYIDDIYVYLRARGQGDLPRGRPAKHEPKSKSFTEAEDACMGP